MVPRLISLRAPPGSRVAPQSSLSLGVTQSSALAPHAPMAWTCAPWRVSSSYSGFIKESGKLMWLSPITSRDKPAKTEDVAMGILSGQFE
ncbi:hypothetical protein D3C78_1695990 [compost metagenome]